VASLLSQIEAGIPVGEGFDAAEVRLAEVRRLRRGRLGTFSRALWVALLFGTAVWVLGALVTAVLTFFFFELEVGLAGQIVYAVDQIGYRVAVGSLLVLAAFLLVRGRTAQNDAPLTETGDAGGIEQRGRALRWALLAGLAVWSVAGVFVSALSRFQPPFSIAEEAPSLPFVTALVIDALAFRVWVAAAILLGLRWLDRRRRAAA
jgi:hypothetical protein